MAEYAAMQGFNMGKYVPPDLEGTTSGNKLHNKHALGARASKLKQGILTVRFEMPYAIWCSTCPKPTIIGQGVRFNAEKKKVGNYYTTPIWSFKMRHAACGGEIELQTDPKNTAYVVISGAKKRDTGEDIVRENDMVIMTDAEREALRQNAFANLEKTIEDRAAAKAATDRIDGLIEASSKHWDDPYAQNQKLRKTFRTERKRLEKQAASDERLLDSMSLGIDLLPESESDRLRASLVHFDSGDDGGNKALSKSLYHQPVAASPRSTRSSSTKGKEVEQKKDALVSKVLDNTRASKDPFLLARPFRGASSSKGTALIPGVKRKREVAARQSSPSSSQPISNGLVDYDSD